MFLSSGSCNPFITILVVIKDGSMLQVAVDINHNCCSNNVVVLFVVCCSE